MTKQELARFKAQVEAEAERQAQEQEKFGQAILWDSMTNAQIAQIMGTTKRQVSKLRRQR